MSFYTSCEDVRLVQENDRSYLVGRARKEDGSMQDTRLDLDSCLGNSNGLFEWGGSNFTLSAQDVRFSFEGEDKVPVLRARLQNAEGYFEERDVNLGERIENIDGSLSY